MALLLGGLGMHFHGPSLRAAPASAPCWSSNRDADADAAAARTHTYHSPHSDNPMIMIMGQGLVGSRRCWVPGRASRRYE